MTVLLTGATGFLGAYVAARLDEELVCLVRGEDPQARLDAALAPLGAHGRAVRGDLTEPLDFVDVRDVRAIVHCAADVRFDRPLGEARAINVRGAARVLQLARRAPRLERIVHVSTAYVSGTHRGHFTEADCDVGQAFRNTYEQTKLEAENLVRASDLPVRVVRPSIVIGESATGWTNSFNVLYPPLRAFSRQLVTRVPADPAAILDVVPVDHVADVILSALYDDAAPDTLHAVAGELAPTAGEFTALAAAIMGVPAPELNPAAADVPPAGLEVYAPYFTVRTRFGAERARALGLEPPPVAAYLERILAFAERARWGKLTLPLERPSAPTGARTRGAVPTP